MISNLQFYGITAILGLIISLAFWRKAKFEKWKVRTIIFAPLTWALVGMISIMTIGDREINGFNEVFRYFDARNFYSENIGGKQIRVFGIIGLISVAYFSLVFDLIWGLKNKVFQSKADNAGKP
jgi:hypothetical protein